ncbi:MAG: DcaP family trimeric outer membrane transporter [Permianibacter sp.]
MHANFPRRHWLAAAIAATLLPVAAQAADSGTTFSYSGYIKLDMIYSSFSEGEVAGNSIARDFYVPSLIPTSDGSGDSYSAFDAHAKQTRFIFATSTPLADGTTFGTHIEMDFMSAIDGDERISNGYEPEVRQAFVKWNGWLAGQAWSVFQDVAALPDAIDFIGPSNSTVFVRQAQVRYSTGNWLFAVENPETTVTPFGGGARISPDDDAAPDFTVRYVSKTDWGHFSIGGVARQLKIDNPTIDSAETGFGVSLSGRYNINADNDIRAMVTTGSGIGRYVGLNTTNDAVLDADGDLYAIDLSSAFVAWRHNWSEKARSTFMVSVLDIDNDTDLTGEAVTASVDSLHANFIYSPYPKLDVGVELTRATRELENGDDGDMGRIQFAIKYAF